MVFALELHLSPRTRSNDAAFGTSPSSAVVQATLRSHTNEDMKTMTERVCGFLACMPTHIFFERLLLLHKELHPPTASPFGSPRQMVSQPC